MVWKNLLPRYVLTSLEIFEMGLLQPRPALGLGYMEVRVDTEASEVCDQITYLYK